MKTISLTVTATGSRYFDKLGDLDYYNRLLGWIRAYSLDSI
jgi:hypothetical protein